VVVPAEVSRLVYASFGPGTRAVDCTPLAGTARRVRLDHGRTVVLTLGPAPAAGLLRQERDPIGARARYLRIAATAGVPVPRLLHHGRDRRVHPRDWLFTAYLPGRPLTEGRADRVVRHELGAVVAALHTVPGHRFGYAGARPHAPTWPLAFRRMVDALLADAEAYGIRLPVAPSAVRRTVARHADALAAVRRPVLVHCGLWDPYVLATVDGAPRLAGLLGGQHYLYGDPLLDFVAPARCRRIEDEPGHPFAEGYAAARRTPVLFDDCARRRLMLYRLHALLVMAVEARTHHAPLVAELING